MKASHCFVKVSGEPISGNSAREGVAGGSRASSLTGGQAGGGQPCRLSPGGAQRPGSGGELTDPAGAVHSLVLWTGELSPVGARAEALRWGWVGVVGRDDRALLRASFRVCLPLFNFKIFTRDAQHPLQSGRVRLSLPLYCAFYGRYPRHGQLGFPPVLPLQQRVVAPPPAVSRTAAS